MPDTCIEGYKIEEGCHYSSKVCYLNGWKSDIFGGFKKAIYSRIIASF